ncbi:hypothetical protein H0H87_008271 [Tephrocybe sp. NHM501043]|nr:hypothetical protein H0H87_008271 [Tephrocybe sp. NHM501043]
MASLGNKVVIVGAGCFGVSTAYHLLRRGFTDVTIIDRAPTLPAPDAASNDMNRTIAAWKDRDEWHDAYQESGVLVLGLSEDEAYANAAYQNDVALGATLTYFSDAEAIRASFSSVVPTATFEGHAGYLNRDNGWADAGQGIAIMIEKVISLGGKFLSSKSVKRISRNLDGETNGVECEDGTFYEAATVVIATGSWTTSAFPDIAARHTTGLSTGKDEAELYKDVPVVLDFRTGFYIFPPTNKGIVKMAMHLTGYTHTKNGVSTPRTITDSPTRGLLIPKHNVRELRAQLRKFLPVIGRLVADAIDGTMEPDVAAKFAIERSYTGSDKSRPGLPIAELDLDQLCTSQDLLLDIFQK